MNNYQKALMGIGTLVVAYNAAGVVINLSKKGINYTNEKIKEFKMNKNLKEVKNGKRPDDFIDVEYRVYC